MKKLNIPLSFGDDFTGDKIIYGKIIDFILRQGWSFGNFSGKGKPIHIGDNKYEIDIVESDAFLAGHGGGYLFWVENNNVVFKRNITWMS